MNTRPTFEDFQEGRARICVVGLGYVGLPLAVAFARKFSVDGFDINVRRISELRSGIDRTGEVTSAQLSSVQDGVSHAGMRFASNPSVIGEAGIIIVTVPTPIDLHRNPDLTPLLKASTLIGQNIRQGTTVVYESTVYPGCTEEDCLPLIEKASGLKWKKDFYAGYSPERINPGDKEHTVDKIKKVVSGDLLETVELLFKVYSSVITAGIHSAPTIKVAEAAKIIENTQRDLNIALMNELALIFERMGVNTQDVLRAAGTKWNFLPFRPGLVGGHCIGVDPYYLTFKAESLGYHPQVILAGRRINDGMGKFIGEKTVKALIANGSAVKGARVLILGWTFKEEVPDVRNTRVIDIYRELQAYGVDAKAFDPHADPEEVRIEYGVDLVQDPFAHIPYDAVIFAVRHTKLVSDFGLKVMRKLGGERPPQIIDVKCVFDPVAAAAEGLPLYQL